jgi:hypothetical protein
MPVHLGRDARVRLLDATASCLGAVRELVTVCEELVLERRARVAAGPEAADDARPPEEVRTRIDLTY